jgi:signal transduction histidine kinase
MGLAPETLVKLPKMASKASRSPGAESRTFTVDTKLFRELGELLVGRDSIALTELIKNSYDADATFVEVTGLNLDDEEEGSIAVVDNGVGMNLREFRTGYLTIAGRGRSEGDRRSRRFRRRFTGEKGIGRLAAHKLARRLELTSVAAMGTRQTGRSRLRASIDWDVVESYNSLSELGRDAVSVRRTALKQSQPAGTAILLSRLRHTWSERERTRFIGELDLFQPPRILTRRLPRMLLPRRLLFTSPSVRDAAAADEFELRLGGEFQETEDIWTEQLEHIAWVVEIESTSAGATIAISSTPKAEGVDVRPERFSYEVPPALVGIEQAAFSARILARDTARGTRRTGDFSSQIAGIRVYLEGFRIPPYGEPKNDWLDLDLDYARRRPSLDLDFPGMPAAPQDVREGLSVLSNASYIGGVFLTHSGVPDLETLINREGFVDSERFNSIRVTVRTALDLLTRIRASRGEAEGSREPESPFLSDEMALRQSLQRSTERAGKLRRSVADLGKRPAREADQLVKELRKAQRLWERAISDRSLLRVLAAVGTQLAAFVHETQGLVAASQQVMRSLETLAKRNPDQRDALLVIREGVDQVAQRIDAQAAYLTETTAASRRRRRRRLPLAENFDVAARMILPVAEREGIEVENEIPDDLRTAPMFPTELTVIFSNLLTNAVKAAGKNGRIQVRAAREAGDDLGLTITMENTGKRVSLTRAEQWFAPFASTTLEIVDPVLGQGMGLGLPITRSILEDYGGAIRFLKPEKGFSTALEVKLP